MQLFIWLLIDKLYFQSILVKFNTNIWYSNNVELIKEIQSVL